MKNVRIIITLVLIGILIVVAMIWHLSQLQTSMINSTALRAAALYTTALTEFRAVYTTDVVATAREHGLDVTHDYAGRDNAIPLPATLGIKLGEEIGKHGSGAHARLYSPYPFPWRTKEHETLEKGFEQEAWEYLSRHPEQVYSRFERGVSGAVLRYAVADIMQPECVACHNSYPGTPKSDWQVGDVRGVLSIALPLDDIVAQTERDLKSTSAAYFVLGYGIFMIVGVAIVKLRKHSELLQQRVDERTSRLETEMAERYRAVSGLAEAEAQNRLLLDSVGEGIYGVDVNGRTTFINPAACDLLGYSEEELLGQPVHELIHHSHADGSHYPVENCLMHAALTDGKVHHVDDEALWRKDGGSFPVEYTSTPMRKEGKIVGAVVTFRDITQRRATEHALQDSKGQYQRLVDNMGDNFVVYSHEVGGKLTFVSDGIASVLGVARDEALGRSWEELAEWRPESLAMARYYREKMLEGAMEFTQFDMHFGREDGDVRAVRVAAHPARDGTGAIVAIEGIVEDVTEHVRQEQALRFAREEAERASHAKSEFLSSMSHELRTPMNAILGFAQILEYDEVLGEEQQDSVHEILTAGNHLLDLINDVLDLAKIESGKINLSLEPVCLSELWEECLTLIKPLAEREGIELGHAELSGYCVRADRIRLKQALINLLSNAIKYNREHGAVELQAEAVDDAVLRIVVADTGKGIAEEKLDKLFLPFDRLGAEGGEVEGTGIGLTITRRLVEMMGGEIGVESQPGVGSRFWITLPLEASALPAHQGGEEDGARRGNVDTSRQHKVLYIEDNPANLKLVSQLLAKRDHINLLTAHEPELGLECARVHRPDLILLDINMPGMDGYQVLSVLQSVPNLKSVPVVAITANAMPRDIERGKAAGFTDYLVKPLDIPRFLEVVDRLLADVQVDAAG